VTNIVLPEYEEQRLDVLRGLDILDTAADEGFDRLTRVIKSYFDVPIALVSLVDTERLWFKSKQGLAEQELPRDGSFCSHAILGDDIFYIPNALKDDRFRDFFLVSGESHIRFYAGVPLSAEGGLKVGTLCILDTKPRKLDSDQFQALKDFGDCVEQQLVQSRLQNDAKFLVSQTSRLNTLLETVADGIVTIDDNGLIESLNTEAAHIFGYEPYEILGQNFNCLMPDLGRGGWKGYLEIFFGEDRKEERNEVREFMGQRKDGTLFPMDLSVREMYLEGSRLFTGIIRDITDRKAVEDELRRGREVLEATKANIPVGISVFDENLKLSVINDLCQKLLNFPDDYAALGTRYENCARYMIERGDFGDGDPDLILHRQMEFAHHPESTRFVNAFGSERQVEVSSRPMPGGGIVSTYVDITDRLRNEEKLESLLKQANSANQAKSDFLSTISHEIRTPLNGVIGVAQMLGDTELDEDQKEKLDAILRSGNTLLDLINDVLDMSKIEAGNLEIEAIPCDLKDIVSAIKIPFEIQARDKNVTFQSYIDPEISSCFISDPTRIRQMVMNLLSNAFKFTEQGSVVLNVVPEGGCEDGIQKILISVRDSGVGIPEERQDAIFDSFSQADNSVARKFGGTGLGLSIVKTLVGMMGGHIHLTSELGKGSCFQIQLPMKLASDEEAASISGDTFIEDKEASRPLHILVAEDNDVNVMITEAFLKKLGHTFETVGNGQIAVDAISRQGFDLILMDIHMPEMDGIEATKTIRGQGRDLPIVGLTAEAFAERHAYFRDIGMNDVLTKPFTEMQLKKVIQNICFIETSENESMTVTEAVDQPDAQGGSVLLAPTLGDPIGSDEKFQEFQEQLGVDVANMLLQKTPDSVMKELEGLREGFANQDSQLILRSAHTIAGVAGSMCAERLAKQASLIEGSSSEWAEISSTLPEFEQTVEDTIAWWNDKLEVS